MIPVTRVRGALIMLAGVLSLAFLPILSGLCAGLVAGRRIASPLPAITSALMAALPISVLLLLLAPRVAPGATDVWLALVLVPLLAGAWLGAATAPPPSPRRDRSRPGTSGPWRP